MNNENLFWELEIGGWKLAILPKDFRNPLLRHLYIYPGALFLQQHRHA